MFSLSPRNHTNEFDGTEIADFIIALGCRTIIFDMKESFSADWGVDNLSLPTERQLLVDAVRYLIDESGFFTMFCENQFLVIPFENGLFNLIVDSQTQLPDHSNIQAMDVTNVLKEYWEMYKNFGADRVFGDFN
jgi:hypothetical protein